MGGSKCKGTILERYSLSGRLSGINRACHVTGVFANVPGRPTTSCAMLCAEMNDWSCWRHECRGF